MQTTKPFNEIVQRDPVCFEHLPLRPSSVPVSQPIVLLIGKYFFRYSSCLKGSIIFFRHVPLIPENREISQLNTTNNLIEIDTKIILRHSENNSLYDIFFKYFYRKLLK